MKKKEITGWNLGSTEGLKNEKLEVERFMDLLLKLAHDEHICGYNALTAFAHIIGALFAREQDENIDDYLNGIKTIYHIECELLKDIEGKEK